MGFDAIKHHCLNTYQPVLMWLPKKSLTREKYRRLLCSGPQVMADMTVGIDGTHTEGTFGLRDVCCNLA